MRALLVFVGALLTGWACALWFHAHVSGSWFGDSRSDPWACIVWVIVTLLLVWIVGWLDDRF